MTTDIFIRNHIKNIEKDETPDEYLRYSGGSKRKIMPYFGGYWYCLIVPPIELFPDDYQKKVIKWFHSTAEAFTPPTVSYEKIEFKHRGNIKSNFFTHAETSNTFNIEFREYDMLPISTILKKWQSYFDTEYAAVSFPLDKLRPKTYKGWAAVFICKPTVSGTKNVQTGTEQDWVDIEIPEFYNDGNQGQQGYYVDRPIYEDQDTYLLGEKDVHECFIFDGVWPSTSPVDILENNITAFDSKTISVEWNFDGTFYNKFSKNSEFFKAALKRYNETFITKGIKETYDFNKNIVG